MLLAIVLVGQFMAFLDASVVNVAAPSIHAGLHASGAGLQLVVAGYTIAYAVLLVTGARLGDLLGHGRMFLAGLAVFTLASLGCGLASSAGVLVAFRFVQGTGAAVMIPQVLSLIQRTFSGVPRARAMSAYAAVLAGGVVVGQVAGGVLVSANLFGTGWRPVFLVNVPIGAALLVAGARQLPAGRAGAGRGLDLPGLLTLALAVLALVVPLVVGQPEELAGLGLGLPRRQRGAVRRLRGRGTQARGPRRLAAGPRPGAAAARGGAGHRGAVRGHDHLRRPVLHAGAAPAGRAR